jgi:ribosome-binding ATPase YchF (GTP1/OBG family)
MVRDSRENLTLLVDGHVNPERDIEVINMELILADIGQVKQETSS